MSKIKLTGSNSGYVEIDSAADAGNLTLTLPTSGVRLLSNTDNVFSGITTTGELDINGKIDVSTDAVIARNLSVGGITTHTGTTTLSDDVTFTGGSYNVLWDKSDNQLEFADNAKLSFGADADLQIYHTGSGSVILHGASSGQLTIGSDDALNLTSRTGTEYYFRAYPNNRAELYFNNSKKIETTNTGAVVTGICTATSFSGSGENLTRTTQLSHRNMIINGAMNICQRFSVNAANNINNQTHTYHVDRFKAYESTDGILQGEWENDNYSDAGFQYSLKYTPATSDTSLSNGQMAFISQVIEMDNMRHLGYGLSYAKTCTLSFYAKASLTGTYAIALINDGTNNRQFVSEFTISNTNWNRYTITIPGDTSGTWNANGLRIAWCLASSTDRHTSTLGSWQSSGTAFYGTSNTVNFMANTSNTFSLTGVQFEIGSSATPYEHRSFGEELARCQRYCYRLGGLGKQYQAVGTGFIGHNGSTDTGKVVVKLPTSMRTNPSVSVIGNTQGFWVHTGGAETGTTDMSAELTGPWDAASNYDSVWLDFGRTGGGSPNRGVACVVYSQSNNAAEILFQAEL